MLTNLSPAPAHETQSVPSRSHALVMATVIAYVLIFWMALPSFLLLTGFRLDMLWPVALPETTATIVGGWGLAVLGAAIFAAGTMQLWVHGHGWPISHLPPTRLVFRGLYRYLRHPLYVGYSIAFAGVALLFGSFWCLAFSLPLLLLGWAAYALFYEEPMLVERFGDAYRAYRQHTRLLWPVSRTPRPKKARQLMLTRLAPRLNALANHLIFYRRGSFILVTYGVLCALGSLLFAQATAISLVQQRLSPASVGLFLIGATLATGLFAWLFWWIGHWRTLIHERWWGIGQIGFVSYGGLTGMLLFTVAFAYLSGYPTLMLTDAVMRGLFFAYAIGRIGCLTFGCCYGKPTETPHGVIYEHPEAKMMRLGDRRRVTRHPAQLYASIHGVVMILLLNAMTWASIPVGLVTAVALMLAGLGRTVTESFRDRKRPFLGRFTYGHLGSWVTFLAGWLLLFVLSPVVDVHAPKPWSVAAFVEGLPLLPVAVLSALLILILFGVHWKRIGSWVG